MALATLGCKRQLLGTRQHVEEDDGDCCNTGLQEATASNSASLERMTGTGNTGLQQATCWQLSNTWEEILDTSATPGYKKQLLATQQHIVGDDGDW